MEVASHLLLDFLDVLIMLSATVSRYLESFNALDLTSFAAVSTARA